MYVCQSTMTTFHHTNDTNSNVDTNDDDHHHHHKTDDDHQNSNDKTDDIHSDRTTMMTTILEEEDPSTQRPLRRGDLVRVSERYVFNFFECRVFCVRRKNRMRKCDFWRVITKKKVTVSRIYVWVLLVG